MSDNPVVKSARGRRSGSWRGEWRFAAAGLLITAILLVSTGACAVWAERTQGQSLQGAHLDQVRGTGRLLAQAAEGLLAANELSALRRLVADSSQDLGLSLCRIALPDGQVVADAIPSNITHKDLPERWAGAVVEEGEAGKGVYVFPVVVPGRGNARLEVMAEAPPTTAAFWQVMNGMGAITILALAATMVAYRWMQRRLRALAAVRMALLAHNRGEVGPAALEVDAALGPEAEAWNQLLAHGAGQRKEAAVKKTLETLQARRHYSDHLASACDALSQGLVLVGRDLRAEYVNGAAAALLRTKREAMLGAEVASFLADDRILSACRASTGEQMPRRTIVEVPREEAGGTTLLRFVVRPVRRDDWGVAMIIIEDITQQRVADQSRHAFVAQATHELRTPLTNIRLYAEMALDEGKQDTAVVSNCLNVINQETFRLDRIVGDILAIAEIEAGTMSVQQDDVRLEELFVELRADYAAQADEAKIKLLFNLPPKLPIIKGDREKIRLAIHNLLGNALKYTPAGGQVTVGAAVDRGRLVVDVTDTGIGMSEEDSQRVFEKFYRAKDPRVGKIKGSGLGLAIAREVVRLHGGDITVQSELDKGSTFTLVLPIPETVN
jgi:signal transduction histidine kinase